MEQIAVIAWRFKLLPSDPMPSFEATYFINSDGTFSVYDEWFTANNAHISQWDYITNKKEKNCVNFYCGGESFTITDDEQSSIATPFFEKHLKTLFRK